VQHPVIARRHQHRDRHLHRNRHRIGQAQHLHHAGIGRGHQREGRDQHRLAVRGDVTAAGEVQGEEIERNESRKGGEVHHRHLGAAEFLPDAPRDHPAAYQHRRHQREAGAARGAVGGQLEARGKEALACQQDQPCDHAAGVEHHNRRVTRLHLGVGNRLGRKGDQREAQQPQRDIAQQFVGADVTFGGAH
jgi:hypothetical protein